VLFHLRSQQLGLFCRVPNQERSPKTGGKCGLRLGDTDFRSCDLGRVSRNEVIHRLFGRESGHRRQHPKGIAGQENDVGRMSSNTGYLRILDEFNRVSAAGVLRNTCVREVNFVGLVIEDNVFKNGPELQGVENVRLRFLTEVNRFRVTTSFDVEYSLVAPDMFIISDQLSFRVSG
jgi:hypothetical protein